MTITATDNLAIARRYLEAIENGAEGGALAEFFTQDIVQEEFPNRLSPIGVHRDLDSLLASARKGKQVIRAQKKLQILFSNWRETRCRDISDYGVAFGAPGKKLSRNESYQKYSNKFFHKTSDQRVKKLRLVGERTTRQKNPDDCSYAPHTAQSGLAATE